MIDNGCDIVSQKKMTEDFLLQSNTQCLSKNM